MAARLWVHLHHSALFQDWSTARSIFWLPRWSSASIPPALHKKHSQAGRLSLQLLIAWAHWVLLTCVPYSVGSCKSETTHSSKLPSCACAPGGTYPAAQTPQPRCRPLISPWSLLLPICIHAGSLTMWQPRTVGLCAILLCLFLGGGVHLLPLWGFAGTEYCHLQPKSDGTLLLSSQFAACSSSLHATLIDGGNRKQGSFFQSCCLTRELATIWLQHRFVLLRWGVERVMVWWNGVHASAATTCVCVGGRQR